MYNILKRSLATFSFVLIAFVSLFFISQYKSEMLGGYSKMISIEKSTTTIKKDLEEIAKDKQSVLARRIVSVKDNVRGKTENTYIPIGGELPVDLPLQQDQNLIQNASDDTLYLIVRGNLSAQELAQTLNQKGHQAIVEQSSSGLTLLKVFLTYPQSITFTLVLIIAFGTLTLADYIAKLRSVSIERLSGRGKYQIALRNISKDSIFLILIASIVYLATVLFLFSTRTVNILSLSLVFYPLLSWLFLLLFLNFFLSNIFYHILQKQALNLSIKGKAPLHLVFILVILTQLLSLLIVMYSVYGVVNLNQQLSTLQVGRDEWSKHANYFATNELYTGESNKDREAEVAFYSELSQKTNLLYIDTNLDRIAFQKNSSANSYYPTPDMVSNEIRVNRRFIETSGIQLSMEAQVFFEQMGDFDRLVLIPKNQESNFSELHKAWLRYEQKGFAPDDAPVKKKDPNEKIEIATYQGGENLFVYPIFTSANYLVNQNAFVHEPIITVFGSAYENRTIRQFSLAHYIFDKPEVVKELISKYKLTASIGSFSNGMYSFENRIQKVETDRFILFFAMMISFVSSILLMVLLNTLYLYQGRKTYFIERLAGKSLFEIHHVYFSILSSSYIFCTLLSVILGFNLFVIFIPLLSLLLFTGIFLLQLRQDKKANILYLKGG